MKTLAPSLGVAPATAFVIANDAAPSTIGAAQELHAQYGDLVQLCGGTADDVEIQAAIDALPTGGGKVVLSEGTFNTAALITAQNNVLLAGAGSEITVLKRSGGSFVISSSATARLSFFGLRDLTVDANSAVSVSPILLHSPYRCTLENLTLKNVSGSGIAALRIEGDETGGSTNAARNHIRNLRIDTAPVGIQLTGAGSGQFCTLNMFYDIQLENISGKGIRFVQWTDNNIFFGVQINLTTDNAKGVIWNDSVTPGSDVGVYNNSFFYLDTTDQGITGATGLEFNETKQNVILGFFHSPEAFNGTLINDVSGRADSYYILQTQRDAAENSIEIISKRVRSGEISDPGNAGAISAAETGRVPLVTTGAETRTLADAIAPGLTLDLYFKTDGGDCVVTTASPCNQTGNNTLTFADAGDHIRLQSIEDGADFEWRVVANDGVALTTV